MNERMSVDRAHRFGCEMMEQKDRCTSQPTSQPAKKKKRKMDSNSMIMAIILIGSE